MKQEIFTIEAEGLGSYAESDNFKAGVLRDNPTSGHISEFIHTISGGILVGPEDSDEICDEVAHKQSNSFSGLSLR